MKEKIIHFINNFVNSIIVVVYILFLYNLSSFLRNQIFDDFSTFISSILGIGIFGFILLVWFLTCIVLTFQKQKVQFSLFQYKFEKICGCIVIIVSTIMCVWSIYSVYTPKENLKDREYSQAYDLTEMSFTHSGIDYIDQKIYQLIQDKDVYITEGNFVCNQNNEVENFRLKVYFNYDKKSYTYAFTYSDAQLYVKFYKEDYGMIAVVHPSWDEFRETIKTISVPEYAYTVYLSGPDTEGKKHPYELSHYYYIRTDIINNQQSLSDKPNHNVGQTVDDGESIDDDYIDENIGYRLREGERTLGTSFFVLDKTTDGGKQWQLWNQDPFCGELGISPEVGFVDESIGFIKITRQQGEISHLYRTVDGGKTFEKTEVLIDDSYDYLTIPYHQDNKYYLKAYQQISAQENEYVLYISLDQGKTWKKQ